MNLNDDTAVAYGVGVLAIFLIVCTAVFIIFLPFINGILTEYNNQITDGDVSKQRGDAMGFIMIIWAAVPVFSLFGVLAWSIVRALEMTSEEVS